MSDLDGTTVEILRAVRDGCDTAQSIRPKTHYTSHDTIRSKCTALIKRGLLRSWIDKVRAAKGRPKWGSRADQRYYALTDEGQRVLDGHEKKAVGES